MKLKAIADVNDYEDGGQYEGKNKYGQKKEVDSSMCRWCYCMCRYI